MAKEESRGEIIYGLEIELDGEIGGEFGGEDDRLESDAPADGLWAMSQPWRSKAKSRLTWRAVAWVAGAAVLGFGVGAVAEPAAKQVTTNQLNPVYNLHLGSQAITAPGQAQMAKLTGAAWSTSPVTPLVVHVVNDGPTTLHLHSGTLTGQHLSNSALIPDGTGVLAPGQNGTLTAHITLDCGNRPPDIGENTSSTSQPLAASIPVSSDGSPITAVPLNLGSRQDDLYIVSLLCSGLPPPLTVSFPSASPVGGTIHITVHNITNQPMRFTTGYELQGSGASTLQVIAAGATVTAAVPLSQICSESGGSPTSPTIGLFMTTLDSTYQTTHEWIISGMTAQGSVCYG